MNDKYIFFLILAILVIAFLCNKNEHLDAVPLSNEAIQSIASVYNKDNLTATNITATGGLNSTGSVNTFGIGGTYQWTLHTPFDGRRILYIAPKKDDNSGWNWDKNTNFENNGNVNFSGTVNAGGAINARGTITAPSIVSSLMSSNGTRKLTIDNDGYITVTDGNGTPIPAKIRKGQLWSDKNDYYVMASNQADRGVVQGYGSNGVKGSFAAGTQG